MCIYIYVHIYVYSLGFRVEYLFRGLGVGQVLGPT